MASTFELVTDEILGKFKSYWDANAAAAVGSVPTVYFESAKEVMPDDNATFAKIYIRHSSVERPTLGGPGYRRFTRHGAIYVNIFAPFLDGSGYSVAQALAQVARDAYEGKRTETAWFRFCRINEMGRDGPWYQINLVIDFEWDEVK